jgi:hypothetical protein
MNAAVSSIVSGATASAGQWLSDISPAVVLAVAMPLLAWIVYTIVGAVRRGKGGE